MTTLHPVTSSNIAAVGYDPEAKELHVKFKTGATHVYSNVSPEQHQALVGAESVGSHFHHQIRNKFQSRKVVG